MFGLRAHHAPEAFNGLTDMSIRTAEACLLVWGFLGSVAVAQTTCALQHEDVGVHICYPNPASSPEDAVIPGYFHFSAQVNAPNGQTIAHFKVLLDDRLVYDNRAAPPLHKLSLETNLISPFDSGAHTLQFAVDGLGTVEVKGLQIVIPANESFCDSTVRINKRTCNASRRPSLQWSLGKSDSATAHPLDEYRSFLNLYARNMKALEADEADAVAVDTASNLYVASHAFSDVELRKYTRSGSIVYDTLIRSCGDGFLSVAGLAIDNAGHAWIAANTTACFHATPDALNKGADTGKRLRGIVIRVDASKPSAIDPVYVTYLSDVDYQITGIRVDEEGNAYLAGTTKSPDFPHESSLSVVEGSDNAGNTRLGFVSVLNSSGSNLLWSALLRNAQLNALALDGKGNIYLTGRAVLGQTISEGPGKKGQQAPAAPTCDVHRKAANACDDILVAEITDHGRQLPYLARLGASGNEEGRAISISPRGDWIFIMGDTDSPDFPASRQRGTSQLDGQQSVLIALRPCITGSLDAHFVADGSSMPPLAFSVALDAFASTSPQQSGSPRPARSSPEAFLTIQKAPSCSWNK